MCVHNLVHDRLGGISAQKTAKQRALWAEQCECGLRGIRVPNALHTYCSNFSFWNKRTSSWVSMILFWKKQKESNPKYVADEEPRGWVFALGYPEKECTYPRLPWDHNNEPVLGDFHGKCNWCRKAVGRGIRLVSDNQDELLFCGNSHYLDWWLEKNGDDDI